MPILNNLTVNEISGAPALYREFQLDANGVLQPNTTTTHIMNFVGMTDVSDSALAYAYKLNTAISGVVDMSDLTQITGSSACVSMFSSCYNITGVILSKLTTITGTTACHGMFNACTSLTSADLPFLTTITAVNACTHMFSYCIGITNVILYSLTSLNVSSACVNMFSNCDNLVSLSFPSITTTTFGTRVNQFQNICQGIPNITLHFPSNVQTQVAALSGYSTTAPFGAVAGTILFDLPATYTLTGADSVTYTRNPKYDTATALAWKVGAYGTTNFTPAYYTSGTSDPTVGTTIYSDSACTTSVTTVSSIA